MWLVSAFSFLEIKAIWHDYSGATSGTWIPRRWAFFKVHCVFRLSCSQVICQDNTNGTSGSIHDVASRCSTCACWSVTTKNCFIWRTLHNPASVQLAWWRLPSNSHASSASGRRPARASEQTWQTLIKKLRGRWLVRACAEFVYSKQWWHAAFKNCLLYPLDLRRNQPWESWQWHCSSADITSTR